MSGLNHKGVLGDHKRVKSKLVSPFNHTLGTFREVSWVNMMIPELLWIALLQQAWGPHRAVEVITAFTRDLRASDPDRNGTIWAAAGKYSALPCGALTGVIEGKRYREDLCGPLAPLHTHYPDHPMRELVPEKITSNWPEDLNSFKILLETLFDRTSTSSTMMQATAIWLAFDARRLKVSSGLALADFPKIEDYPGTEQSQRVAASIRAAINMMFGEENLLASGADWSIIFWNRGLELEPCEY